MNRVAWSLPFGAEHQVESPFCLKSLSPCGAISSRADTWLVVAEVQCLPKQPGLVWLPEVEVWLGSWVGVL